MLSCCAAAVSEFLSSILSKLSALRSVKGLLSSRLRFMIADVLDVQKAGWVNRRAAEGAKKISTVHEEAQRQETQTEVQRLYAAMQQQQQQQQQGSGSSSAKPSPASRMARPTDRYALRAPAPAAAAAVRPSNSTSPSPAPAAVNGEAGAMNGSVAVQQEPRRTAAAAGSQDEREDAGWSGAAAAPALSDSAVRARCSSLLREYLSSSDLADALLSVRELGRLNVDGRLVSESLMQGLDSKRDEDRQAVVRLLLAAHAAGLLSAQHVELACLEVLPQLEDLSIDSPRCVEHLSLMLAALVLGRALSLSAVLAPAAVQSVAPQSPHEQQRFVLRVLQMLSQQAADERQLQQAVREAQQDGSSPLLLERLLSEQQDREAARRRLVDAQLQPIADCL